MQAAANTSLVLTAFSSLEQSAGVKATSYRGFYQQLASEVASGVHKRQIFGDLAHRLVLLAERSHAFRQMGLLEQVSQILVTLPLRAPYESIGQYYQALCVHSLGRGDVGRAEHMFEQVATKGPVWYRLRAIQSLAANYRRHGDAYKALSAYREAGLLASKNGLCDPYAIVGTQKMYGVISSEDGNHSDALALLEGLFPLAHSMRHLQSHVYYDYLNSLAVELCEAGRLEEARNVSRVVLMSPFAGGYPEWRETWADIGLRSRSRSRSVIAFAHPPRAGNVVRLPFPQRVRGHSNPRCLPATQPARVLSLQGWKERIAKSNGDSPKTKRSRPLTRAEKETRIKEMENLGTRGMLLRAMEMLGDESVSDDQLRRALIILEGVEPDENPGV